MGIKTRARCGGTYDHIPPCMNCDDCDERFGEADDEVKNPDANGWFTDINTAPTDRPVLVWIPVRKNKKGRYKGGGYMVNAVWHEDDRVDQSEHRADLMRRHEGYWAKNKVGHAPIKFLPSHWRERVGPPVGAERMGRSLTSSEEE